LSRGSCCYSAWPEWTKTTPLALVSSSSTTTSPSSNRHSTAISPTARSGESGGRAALEGLPQDYIDRHKPAADGTIAITTDYPDILPAMKFVKSDALRRQLFEALNTRAYPKNGDVLRQMMQTRYEIATLLGYPSWADYAMEVRMAGGPEKVERFYADLVPGVRDLAADDTLADREFAMLLAEKKKTDPAATAVGDYEVGHLQELLRRSKYDFDSQSVRPYLPYAQVKQGILDTAASLFGLTFRQEPGAPAWDPSVETWDAIDNGKPIGRFYLDMHPRPGKFSHAEMVPAVDGVRGKQLPEAVLVCNFPKPAAGDAGLMEYGDVVTFFHEFGHLMHWILGGQWAGISGITMESISWKHPRRCWRRMRSPRCWPSLRGIIRPEGSRRTGAAHEPRWRSAGSCEPAEHVHGDLLRYPQRQAAGRGSGCSDDGKHEAV
jgi:thimet oligopeptidase